MGNTTALPQGICTMNDGKGGSYTLNINDNELVNKMLNAKVGDEFQSDVFTIGGLNWRIEIIPNGNEQSQVGAVMIYVKLIKLPSSWKNVTIMRSIQSPQTQSSDTRLSTYIENDYSLGWPTYTLRLDELIKSKYKRLTFIISIDIIRIILKENENIFYNTKYPFIKHKKLTWNVDMNTCKTAYNGKQLNSDIFDNMWCIRLYPNGNNTTNNGKCVIGLELLLYPLNVYGIKVQWQLLINALNYNQTKTRTFKIGEAGYIMIPTTFNEFIKCDKIEIIINVLVLKTYDKNNKEIEIKSISKWDNYKQKKK
eukprot:202970_1